MSNKKKDKKKRLDERLELIKKRHRKLIVEPRQNLMEELPEEDDSFSELEEPEEVRYMDELAASRADY
jgi:hypothetical protein